MPAQAPVLFLSYSHDSEEHRERVLGLSERLRSDGYDTRLDQYENGTPAEGWPRWTLDRLEEAAFVLLICTETYYRRFRGHEAPGRGQGVDWEGALITQELYASRSRAAKFVPILFEPRDTDFIPEPLRNSTHYTLTSEHSYRMLCDFLDAVAGVEPGPLGTRHRKTRRRASPSSFDRIPSPPRTTPTALPVGPTGLTDRSSSVEVAYAVLAAVQRDVLSTWRLFNLPRDIDITNVYVQEMVAEAGRGIIVPLIQKKPPIPEAELLQKIVRETGKILTLEGPPGAGKTTLLKNWTLAMLSPGSQHTPGSPRAVFLSLKYLSSALKSQDAAQVTSDVLASCLTRSFPSLRADTVRELFDSALGDRRGAQRSLFSRILRKQATLPPSWVFLWDGFDELAPEFREPFIEWLESLPTSISSVVTSRPYVLERSPRGAAQYETCDFNDDQIASFVSQWFATHPALGETFIENIRSSTTLQAVCAVPLLLTCLSMDVELRENAGFENDTVRTDILRRVVEILLEEWDAYRERRAVDNNYVTLATRALRALAKSYSYDSQIPLEDVITVCKQAVGDSGFTKTRSEEIAKRLVNAGRILIGDARFGVSFNHKAFYDYFYAQNVVEHYTRSSSDA